MLACFWLPAQAVSPGNTTWIQVSKAWWLWCLLASDSQRRLCRLATQHGYRSAKHDGYDACLLLTPSANCVAWQHNMDTGQQSMIIMMLACFWLPVQIVSPGNTTWIQVSNAWWLWCLLASDSQCRLCRLATQHGYRSAKHDGYDACLLLTPSAGCVAWQHNMDTGQQSMMVMMLACFWLPVQTVLPGNTTWIQVSKAWLLWCLLASDSQCRLCRLATQHGYRSAMHDGYDACLLLTPSADCVAWQDRYSWAVMKKKRMRMRMISDSKSRCVAWQQHNTAQQRGWR